MGKSFVVWLVIAGLALYSCSNANNKVNSGDQLADNAIVQQQDGTISLEVNKADTYHDVNEPESNTAEWSVVVSKSGRYDVWLTSAAKDPSSLKYVNSVMLSIKDDMLEARPSVDKVVENLSDVSYPYKADSFMGSLYLKDTGVYNIQIVSDRIVPDNNEKQTDTENTKLVSVSLTPSE